MTREEELYRETVGEPHNLPPDHPDLWQWLYRGTKEERETLLERLCESQPSEPEPVQEGLF